MAGYTRVGEGFEAFTQADEEEMFSSRLLQGLNFSVRVLWPRRRMGQT